MCQKERWGFLFFIFEMQIMVKYERERERENDKARTQKIYIFANIQNNSFSIHIFVLASSSPHYIRV